MATVTGKTSEKIDELVNASVIGGQLAANGNLTLETRGGTTLSLGSVSDMITGGSIDASGHLILTRRDGSTIDAGAVGRTIDAWPVGSIFITVATSGSPAAPTNPSTLLGGGTWTRYAKGRVLVGVDEADTSFDVLEEVGGEKSHVLTAAESGLRDHGHSAATDGQGNHTHGVDGINNFIRYGSGTMDQTFGGTQDNSVGQSLNLGYAGNHGHNVTVYGSGAYDALAAHNNLQPYISVYMWKRTA